MLKLILALLKIKGIGNAFIKKNRNLFFLSKEETEHELLSISDKITSELINANLSYADSLIQRCDNLGIRIISIVDSIYPQSLLELSDPPAILFLLGNQKLLENKKIAIIGTRKATKLGASIASRVGEYFSQNYSICNGLVDGIDKASVSSNQGILQNVIGVLSGGLNYKETTNKNTRELAELVLQNKGLLVSEFEPDQKEDQFSGSKASRIQAGLSSALILVQSSQNGGSKYTLKAFSGLNRILGIIDFSSNDEYKNDDSFSANRLINENGINGIMTFCSYKTLKNIRIKSLHKLRGLEDYHLIEESLNSSSLDLF